MLFFPDIPEVNFYPRNFLIGQVTALGLMIVSISKGLAPPTFDVDYVTHRQRVDARPSQRWWTIAMQSSVVVEAESCRFLGLSHRLQLEDLVSF